ncbi:DUF2905 domain-containing protein [Calditrichota bacterium]
MDIGKSIIIIGVILIFLGLSILYIPAVTNWFGKLPGDIKIERENTKVFIQITTMIIISIVLTILINLVLWLLKR